LINLLLHILTALELSDKIHLLRFWLGRRWCPGFCTACEKWRV